MGYRDERTALRAERDALKEQVDQKDERIRKLEADIREQERREADAREKRIRDRRNHASSKSVVWENGPSRPAILLLGATVLAVALIICGAIPVAATLSYVTGAVMIAAVILTVAWARAPTRRTPRSPRAPTPRVRVAAEWEPKSEQGETEQPDEDEPTPRANRRSHHR